MRALRASARTLSLAAILAGCHADKTPTGSGGYPLLADVYMPNISVYSPVQSEIARTGTVRFNFPPEEHNVVFVDRVAGTPEDIPITKSSIVPRQFNVTGTYNYYCTLHPQMVALIIVH
jgi:plastocyanin